MKSNGRPMPPAFDRFESFSHDELTAKHCYFRCSRPPDVVDGIKIFDKVDNCFHIRLCLTVHQLRFLGYLHGHPMRI